MPQDNKYGIVRRPPEAPKVDLPKGNPEDFLNRAEDLLVGILGMDHGQDSTQSGMPGSASNGVGQMIGAAMPLLGMMKAFRAGGAIKTPTNVGDALLREHIVPPQMPHDISPDVKIPGFEGLPEEEVKKARELLSPKRREPSEPRPTSGRSRPSMSDEDARKIIDDPFVPSNPWNELPASLPNQQETGWPGRTGTGTSIIPPATAKEMTRLMKEMLFTDAPDYIYNAVAPTMDRAPRVMGHTQIHWGPDTEKILNETHPGREVHGTQTSLYNHLAAHPPNIPQGLHVTPDMDHLSVIKVRDKGGFAGDLPEIVAHEAAHAAQQLKLGPKFYSEYEKAGGADGPGYYANKFEVGARGAEKKAGWRGEFGQIGKKDSQRRVRLRKRLIDDPANEPEGYRMAPADQRMLIDDMLHNDYDTYMNAEDAAQSPKPWQAGKTPSQLRQEIMEQSDKRKAINRRKYGK